MAMPPATASPSKTPLGLGPAPARTHLRVALHRPARRLAAFLRTVSVLIELALDQLGDRQQRRLGVGARGEQLDLAAGTRASIMSPMIERPETLMSPLRNRDPRHRTGRRA